MSGDEAELAYYRAVEDFFAGLRGLPHALSPRDFQILRSWWRDGVPLEAVTAGVTEVFARRRESGEEDPVVSLAYCRHAVRRAARRLAESRAGTAGAPEPDGLEESLSTLARLLERAAAEQEEGRPRVAGHLRSMGARLLELATPDDPAAVEEALYALETALLEGCWNALEHPDREAIEERARAAAGNVTGPALDRSIRAHRDRELRLLLGLPRLELP